MTKKNRLIAVLLALTVVFVMLFSAFFIVEHAEHECVGDGCRICYAISVCEHTLKGLGSAFAVAAVTAFFGIAALTLPSEGSGSAFCTSLVSLKVKLSD